MIFYLIVLLTVEDPQDCEEQVDDVQVQADGSRNLLLNVIVSQNQLRVDQNVAAEDESRDHAVHELDGLASGEERSHEAEDDKHPERAEEIRHPAREVVLRLAGEQRQCDEDAEREDEGLDHDSRLVEGRDDADGVGFEDGEAGQEEQVRRVGLALPEGEEHEGDGAEERAPHHPAVVLDP